MQIKVAPALAEALVKKGLRKKPGVTMDMVKQMTVSNYVSPYDEVVSPRSLKRESFSSLIRSRTKNKHSDSIRSSEAPGMLSYMGAINRSSVAAV